MNTKPYVSTTIAIQATHYHKQSSNKTNNQHKLPFFVHQQLQHQPNIFHLHNILRSWRCDLHSKSTQHSTPHTARSCPTPVSVNSATHQNQQSKPLCVGGATGERQVSTDALSLRPVQRPYQVVLAPLETVRSRDLEELGWNFGLG